MNDWTFDKHEVVTDRDGQWWHILQRFVDVDTEDKRYRLADATHTEYQSLPADDVEHIYESAGWSTTTKPAAERGYRVNGILCGPSGVDYFCGPDRAIRDTYDCPECGSTKVNVIIDYETEEKRCRCEYCKHEALANSFEDVQLDDF